MGVRGKGADSSAPSGLLRPSFQNGWMALTLSPPSKTIDNAGPVTLRGSAATCRPTAEGVFNELLGTNNWWRC